MITILHLKVLTGKKQFQLNWKKEENVLCVETKSNPEKGKANKEIVRELKKFFEKETKIVSGFKSKEKIVEISSPKKEVMEKLIL
ncbi:MAG: DUF167 domain-containing protein [Candidatus Diapherotrites archaeon]|jgi:uncharacterized protein (TIGR00251 family)|uniref:DUF167 domain-containing protein n=1 Tax=Candidatus Iainarchaeum sp. TaxID=3101447 RepID=A0A8T5GH34_9ARCH|nr:DUF167 domain-containing protein [Candidatus Diapherotrites archaeon]MBT7241722.1 DUF167 domain-containing protein [Candidatus Diapherotrites archaeon]